MLLLRTEAVTSMHDPLGKQSHGKTCSVHLQEKLLNQVAKVGYTEFQ